MGKPKAKRHHLDRRVDQIAANLENGNNSPDQLYSTKQLAKLFAVSEQLVEIWRHQGEGPRWIKLGPRCIRYKRTDVLSWLNERARFKALEVARAIMTRKKKPRLLATGGAVKTSTEATHSTTPLDGQRQCGTCNLCCKIRVNKVRVELVERCAS
jgi:predicted DNA-binding transcriptional regulator AlpA